MPMAPMLVSLRPSRECTYDPSELARHLFRDGGCLISCCARPRNMNDPTELVYSRFRDGA